MRNGLKHSLGALRDLDTPAVWGAFEHGPYRRRHYPHADRRQREESTDAITCAGETDPVGGPFAGDAINSRVRFRKYKIRLERIDLLCGCPLLKVLLFHLG
jgi:hypothetical protein